MVGERLPFAGQNITGFVQEKEIPHDSSTPAQSRAKQSAPFGKFSAYPEDL
jgi:hypothetical protein